MNNNINLSEFLTNQPKEKQFAVISFFITNPEALKKLKAQWALRDTKHGVVLDKNKDRAQSIDEDKFGGSIALIDPLKLEYGFISEIKIPLAFGLCANKKHRSLYVTSGKVIRQIKNGRCVKVLGNTLFNDLHSLTLTASGQLLVAATGTDAILEVDFEDANRVSWDWLATEHGFNVTPAGKTRYINRNFNYQLINTTTPEHTTHVNAALNDLPNRVLATLFHQGQLIEIDKISKKSRVILSGLKLPHNIHERRGGFILSDTRSNRVLLMNKEFTIEKEFKAGFDWVQDAYELVGSKGYLIADSNNDRVVLLDCLGKISSTLQWPSGSRKIASIELIDSFQARDIFLSQ